MTAVMPGRIDPTLANPKTSPAFVGAISMAVAYTTLDVMELNADASVISTVAISIVGACVPNKHKNNEQDKAPKTS